VREQTQTSMAFLELATRLFIFGVAGMGLASLGLYGRVPTPSARARMKSGPSWRSVRSREKLLISLLIADCLLLT
jgi:hypothetical protein